MVTPLTTRGWTTHVSDDKRTRIEVFYDLETGLIESITMCQRAHYGDSWGPATEVRKVA